MKFSCPTELYICTARILLLVSMFLGSVSFSQENDLLRKAHELVYSNPDEAIKIGEHILKSGFNTKEEAYINLILSRSYQVKGDYNTAITKIFEAGNQVNDKDLKTQIEINLLKSELLRNLHLYSQSNKYLHLAEKSIPKLNSKSVQDSLQFNVQLEHIYLNLNKRQNDKALALINSAGKDFKNFLMNYPEETERLYIAKERTFRNLSQHDSAFTYIDKLLDLSELQNSSNLLERAIFYNELGHLYLQNKEFAKSEEMLFVALRFASILNNIFLLEEINRNLAIGYLASNQKSKYQVYNDEFLILNNKVELMEQESINNLYNILSNEAEVYLDSEEKRYDSIIKVALACLLFILLIGSVIVIRNHWRKKRLNEIIRYLEISRNNYIKKNPSKKVVAKKITIPEETENLILSKLKRFENSQKFLNKDMSLAVLSGQFETNTKYLSEIINKHYNDNFNTFINKLRINYIIEKLKNDSNYMNYKISFLAEESGFSSHSSFATVFKTIVGMSPATFISLLEEDKEEELNKTKKNNG
ncbi:helix-turn-helix domain-containing protein [Mariniflexile sp.]|uniref:helix-turn-helix domain-containing protein n=1 Tax=Mariniflexile sp. TaxID=1979402 RepID=UPI00356279FE